MITLKHGRQDVEFADIAFDYTMLAAGANPAISLPGNAEVIGGYLVVDTAFNATTTLSVGDSGNEARYLAATDATVLGLHNLVPTGLMLSAKGTLDINANQAVTAGAGRVRVMYVIIGRSEEVQP